MTPPPSPHLTTSPALQQINATSTDGENFKPLRFDSRREEKEKVGFENVSTRRTDERVYEPKIPEGIQTGFASSTAFRGPLTTRREVPLRPRNLVLAAAAPSSL